MIKMNYIYLLQEREFIKTNENIFKIGKTKQENLKRLGSYPIGSQLLFQMICYDCDTIVKQILLIFHEKYISQRDIGYEYFKGNYKEMIDDIYNCIKKEQTLPCIKNIYSNMKDRLVNTKYILITIKPNTDRWTIYDFNIGMTKMMTKPWIQKYLWVIEKEIEITFYFQAIIEKPQNKSFNHILREIKSSGNRFCDTSNDSYFNAIYITNAEKDRKIEYITDKNKLNIYYNNGIIE